MYERVEQCPVCQTEDFNNILICKDHTVSGESFAIVECNDCTHRFTNPRPAVTDIGKFYQAEDYISHSDTNKGIINQAYKIVRRFTIQHKINLIKSLVQHQNPKILDIGCGTGTFLNAVNKKGWGVTGVEPSDEAIAKCEEKGLQVHRQLQDITDTGTFDVVTMWHVLEHVYDLHEYTARIKKMLKPGGYLVVAVPNHLSKDAQYYGADWAAYDVPRHIQHFNQHSIKKLMRKSKLSFVNQFPMKFDAFYISLLSEKYQNGKDDKFAAFKVAWNSNKQASETGEYSSLIYVFQKK